MTLNFVEIQSGQALGYGLDFRVDLDTFSLIAPTQIYARREDISENETPLHDLVDAYYLPSSPESCQIYSTDDTDLQNIMIYYYPDINTEEPLLQSIDLSGNTSIDISENILRLSRIVSNPQSGTINKGDIYIHQTGNTNNILGTIRNNIGFSEDSYLYIPANTFGYLIHQTLNSNCDETDNCELYADRYLNPLLPTYYYRVQNNCIRTNIITESTNSTQGLIPNTTYMLKCKKTGGTNVKCRSLFEFVFVK